MILNSCFQIVEAIIVRIDIYINMNQDNQPSVLRVRWINIFLFISINYEEGVANIPSVKSFGMQPSGR